MINAVLAAAGIALILIASEIAWKRARIYDELARKFVHISSGIFIAFLPFWVEYRWIMVLAVGFVIVNIINRYTNFFHAIHAVKRKSWGDVLFGVGVFIVAFFEPNPWFFTASILQVSLADGLAAVAGVTYGQSHGRYYLFGQPKSVVGSAIFLVTSFGILTGLLLIDSYFADPISLWPMVVMLPLLLVSLENLAVYGTDNVVLPVATLAVLSLL
jgi:dolichol kinase